MTKINQTSIPFDAITKACEQEYGTHGGYVVKTVVPHGGSYVAMVSRWYKSSFGRDDGNGMVTEHRVMCFRAIEIDRPGVYSWVVSSNMMA